MMRQRFDRDIRSLDAVFSFLRRFADEERLDARASYVLDLAVEEFFTNIVKYGRGTSNDVFLEAVRSGGTVTVRLEEQTPCRSTSRERRRHSSTSRSPSGSRGDSEFTSRGRCLTD